LPLKNLPDANVLFPIVKGLLLEFKFLVPELEEPTLVPFLYTIKLVPSNVIAQ